MPRRKTAGRPPLPPSQKVSRRVSVNFKPEDMEKVDRAARLQKFTRTGSWIAAVALERAEEAIGPAKPERKAR